MAARRGFTLIELTIALALISVLMGLVLVRFDFGSRRQKVIQEGRKLGNLISTYRERAIQEECLYAFNLDIENGTYSITKPKERSIAPPLTVALVLGKLSEPAQISKVLLQGNQLSSPVVIYLDSKGVISELSIDIAVQKGPGVLLTIDPLVNEVRYNEH